VTHNTTSSTGVSPNQRTSDYRDEVEMTRHSIEKHRNKIKKHAFGSSIKRFDSKQDLQKMFNNEPGPGSYLHIDDKDSSSANEGHLSSRNHEGSQYYSQSGDTSASSKQMKSPGFGSKD